MLMSNTVKIFDVTFDGPQDISDLYKEVARLHAPEDAPSLVLRAMTHGDQVWEFGMVQTTLSYNWGSKLFTLTLNNLVA